MSVATLTDLRQGAETELQQVTSLDQLGEWERSVFGPKGSLTLFMRSLGSVSAEERPALGRAANETKIALTATYEEVKRRLDRDALAERLSSDAVDVTLPGRRPLIGSDHPVSQITRELSDIFALLGFQTGQAPPVTARRNPSVCANQCICTSRS